MESITADISAPIVCVAICLYILYRAHALTYRTDALTDALLKHLQCSHGDGTMTRQEYRMFLKLRGIKIYPDQNICHLIAFIDGGADHIDNFVVASASLNQSLGNRHDYYLAEVVGLEMMKKAVAVSRKTGYKGPSAEELIAQAKMERTKKMSA